MEDPQSENGMTQNIMLMSNNAKSMYKVVQFSLHI